MPTIRRILSLFAPIAFLAACGDPSGAGVPEPGTFQLTVSGDRTFSRTGRVFATEADGYAIIALGTHPEFAGADTVVGFFVRIPPGLSVGTHSISAFTSGEETVANLYFATPQDGVTHAFQSVANSGTLTLTQSAGAGLEGEFAFDVEGSRLALDPPPVEHLRIIGRFRLLR